MNNTFVIHRIDTDYFELKVFTDHQRIVKHIIRSALTLNIDAPDPVINVYQRGDLTYFLHTESKKEKRSKWSSFLPQELSDDVNFDLMSLNLLLFISTGQILFIIVGGKAYQNVVKYIDDRFGISMISKLLDKEKDSLLYIETRSITGETAKAAQQYKKELLLHDFVKFGKVPTHIILALDEEKSKLYFSHITRLGEKIKIEAGTGFKIKKSMDFEDLHKTLESLEVIFSLEEQDYLSSYEQLSQSKEKDLIQKNLYPQLIEKLYDFAIAMYSSAKSNLNVEFDFVHPSKHLEYISSDYYILKEKEGRSHKEFHQTENYFEIPETILKRAVKKVGDSDDFGFKAYLQGVRITSYKTGKKTYETSCSFLYFLNVEIAYVKMNYFYMDKFWYKLKPSFLEDLNNLSATIIRQRPLRNGVLPKGWNRDVDRTEKLYNLKYAEDEKYLVFDTVTVDNIELCDIFTYDDNDAYLIHVKNGFNAEMRSLASQIKISADRLSNDIASGEYIYLQESYDKVKNPQISWTTFIDVLLNRRINYVLAFTSSKNQAFEIAENIEKIKSNIAKYSIIDCNQKMAGSSYNLLFKQIMKTDEGTI